MAHDTLQEIAPFAVIAGILYFFGPALKNTLSQAGRTATSLTGGGQTNNPQQSQQQSQHQTSQTTTSVQATKVPANGQCNSHGNLYLNLNEAQQVYNAAGGGTFVPGQSFVAQCGAGYVVLVNGNWL